MRLERRRPAVGHEELAAPTARDRYAVGIGGGEKGARAPLSPSGRGVGGEGGRHWTVRRFTRIPHPALRAPSPGGRRARSPLPPGAKASARAASPRARRLASSARCERSRRKASMRVTRSTASPPSPRSVSKTAISLAVLAFARSRRVDHHARETWRQRKARDRPAFVGDASVAVDGADPGQKRLGFHQRATRRGIEEAERARIGDAPKSAVEHEARRDRRREFPARRKAEARRSRPPPTADSRLRARRGPRARAAGRHWRG